MLLTSTTTGNIRDVQLNNIEHKIRAMHKIKYSQRKKNKKSNFQQEMKKKLTFQYIKSSHKTLSLLSVFKEKSWHFSLMPPILDEMQV